LPASGLASSETSMVRLACLSRTVRADHGEFPANVPVFLHRNLDGLARRDTQRPARPHRSIAASTIRKRCFMIREAISSDCLVLRLSASECLVFVMAS